jgi:hypothetical protein
LKLIIKQTYYLLAVYFAIFVLVGISFYQVTQFVISEDFNKKLYDRKEFVIKLLSASDSVLTYQQFSGNAIAIQKYKEQLPSMERINDTLIFNKVDNKLEEYRQLSFTKTINGAHYKISVRRLLIETEDLAQALLILSIILFVILLLSLFLANNWINKKIWNPFYTILENIKLYQVSQSNSISFPKTDIQEFKELNNVIQLMTDRLKKDFTVLKEFTENTSHELQTPLSVIKSQLELLMQADNLTELQYKNLSTAYSSINKLSKLNEALGLLTKIENKQFANIEPVELYILIENKLFNCENLLEIKSIEVIKEIKGEVTVQMNSTLADILIENIINNSIKHNIKSEKIIIEINNKLIKISNTGNQPTIPTSELFQRFSKSNSKSFGLGLSIVKEICDQNHIKINYEYIENLHVISLNF